MEVTLHPIGDGELIEIPYPYPPEPHHDKVFAEDTVWFSDGTYPFGKFEGSYVWAGGGTLGEKTDLFILSNIPPDVNFLGINYVKVIVKLGKDQYPYGKFKITLRTHGRVFQFPEETMPTGLEFREGMMNFNPYTNGLWTVAEVNDLQAGLTMFGIGSYGKHICDYVAVIVDGTTEAPEPPIVTGWCGWIVESMDEASAWFYECYLTTFDWMWPFNTVANWFYYLSDVFAHLREDFTSFCVWANNVTDKLKEILSLETITAYLQDFINYATWAWNWITNAWQNVTNIVTDWWSANWPYVQSYIDAAVEGLDALIAIWDEFWVNIFPDLVSFTWLTTWWSSRVLEVQDLINTAVLNIVVLMEGWQEIRDQVFEFFNDPYQWIYDRLDEWFERFW